MYQNNSNRAGGGNNFLWVILSTLIVVILLFAVYINNRNNLGPVIAEVNSINELNLKDDSSAQEDSSLLVQPEVQSKPEPEKPKEETPKQETVKEEKPSEDEKIKNTQTEEKAKQEKGKEEKVKEDKAKEDKAKEAKVKEEKAKEDKAKEEKAKEEKAREEKKTKEPKDEKEKEVSKNGIMIDYEIKKGDVMGKILSKFGNSASEVMKNNDLKNLDKIKLGQKLKIKVKAIHKVESGDSPSTLAAKYNVSSEKIKKANGLGDDNIKTGTKIYIPLQ